MVIPELCSLALGHRERKAAENIKAHGLIVQAFITLTDNRPGAICSKEEILEIVVKDIDVVFLKPRTILNLISKIAVYLRVNEYLTKEWLAGYGCRAYPVYKLEKRLDKGVIGSIKNGNI